MRTSLPTIAMMLVLCAGFAAGSARADALDGDLEVQSAFVSIDEGVYQLHARVKYPLNDGILAALRDGVSLRFSLEVQIARERRLWLDAGVASLTLSRELAYHSVSDRFIVRDIRSGEQQSFATADAALDSLGAFDAVPVLVAPQVRTGGNYRVSVRASVRRGRLTDALRVILFWTDDWQRESAWYSWSLPQ